MSLVKGRVPSSIRLFQEIVQDYLGAKVSIGWCHGFLKGPWAGDGTGQSRKCFDKAVYVREQGGERQAEEEDHIPFEYILNFPHMPNATTDVASKGAACHSTGLAITFQGCLRSYTCHLFQSGWPRTIHAAYTTGRNGQMSPCRSSAEGLLPVPHGHTHWQTQD
eukprot:4227468-Amphidinium_carterae.2